MLEKLTTRSNDPAVQAIHLTVQAYLASAGAAFPPGPWELGEELPGGASTRRFFRVQLRSGGSFIAMFVPAPSQEIQKAQQVTGVHAFSQVQQLLEERGIRVPRIWTYSEEHQVLLVEDLGDHTLAQYLTQTPEQKTQLYQIAVRDLARAQKTLGARPLPSLIRERSFDAPLLSWEVDHFHTWALAARGLKLSPTEQGVFERARDHLAQTISAWPRSFVHRDYQSRNLMVQQNARGEPELIWIDFQDAMLGPRVYDLVALLTDSYQTFERNFLEERILEYCEQLGEREQFSRVLYEFDFVTVQRKLKDAGRFIFIDRVNGNPHFLQFVDSTIEKARAALHRLPDEAPLRELAELLSCLLDAPAPMKQAHSS